jgi:hypothetical protein
MATDSRLRDDLEENPTMVVQFVKQLSLLSIATLIVSAIPASALALENDNPSAYLVMPSINAATQTHLAVTEKALVHNYIEEQIQMAGLTKEEFFTLDPEQQRLVIKPGRQFILTREAKRAINPQRRGVPRTITSKLTANETLSSDIITKYSVALPKSISLTINGSSSTASQWLLIGDKLVLINENNVIQEVLSNIL